MRFDELFEQRGLVASKLKEYSISSFDCLFITHYDSDHIGGADTVLDRFDVENIILPTTNGEKSSAYRQVLASLETTDANIVNASEGKLIKINAIPMIIYSLVTALFFMIIILCGVNPTY